MSRITFLGTDGKPCNREPWGTLTAIEAATGEVRWNAPSTVSLGGPTQVGDLVIFGGEIWARKLKAWSADDGQKMWEADLPHPAHSVPSAYVWKGKQYIVVCAGGHGKLNDKDVGDEVVAFTLE